MPPPNPEYKEALSNALAFKQEYPDEKHATAARIYQVNTNTLQKEVW
jgi:hypothetical protein